LTCQPPARQGLVVTKFDRLTRSVIRASEIIERELRANLAGLLFCPQFRVRQNFCRIFTQYSRFLKG
jgi:hypothetical protein